MHAKSLPIYEYLCLPHHFTFLGNIRSHTASEPERGMTGEEGQMKGQAFCGSPRPHFSGFLSFNS
jgi:hypothetical protein